MPADLSTVPTMSTLQATWPQLSDLERAREVMKIQQAGYSLRHIARQLNCSDGLLRRLLKSLKAPLQDLALARTGKISTNELIRRAEAAAVRQSAQRHEARAAKRAQEAQRGSRMICAWLAQERIASSYAEQIITEARALLWELVLNGKLPTDFPPANMPLKEVIALCRPKSPCPENAPAISWYACWLVRWTARILPDITTRDKAIDLALEHQCRR